MTVTAPGPYEAKFPRDDRPRGGYKTAEQELAEALEGTAPHPVNVVAGLVGPARTLELAKVVRRATTLAVRRRAAEHLADALAAVDTAIDGICMCPDYEEAVDGLDLCRCGHTGFMHGPTGACTGLREASRG